MQDRFKFRLWDKSISEMSYDVCVGFIKDGAFPNDWICADTTCGQITYRGDKLKDICLMQCTGLKDKNDKLIYEGDILKIELGGYPKKHFINEAVIWDRKRWVLAQKRNCKGTPRECRHCIHCERIEARKEWFFQTCDTNFRSFYTNEVIGNIYENPELLEV